MHGNISRNGYGNAIIGRCGCCFEEDIRRFMCERAYHNKHNGGKLHGNISQNGHGNAIIGRYGGCFEEGIWWVYGTGEVARY